MDSEYLIQVLHKPSGKVVQWAPGLSVEKDFIAELVERVSVKGVGIACSRFHVCQDIRAACEELLHDLKSRV